MTRKAITPAQVHALRDALEADLEEAVSREMRAWLKDVRRAALRAVRAGHTSLVAAGTDEMPGMATVAAWWAQRVDGALTDAVRSALYRAFNRWTDMSIDASPAEEATNRYLSQVRDRLVLGEHFGVRVYEDSFDRIRLALATGQANGWTTNQIANRIAAELGWEKDGDYWRGELGKVDRQMDEMLDALGPPGTAAREHARLNDPHVQALRDQRNTVIKRLDAERSIWKTRATLIARTEGTGSANFGAYQALTLEGVATKVWLSTGDGRTRPTHRAADGQEVGIAKKFAVGTARLEFPGDPSGPIDEIGNCRCAMIGGDYV